MKKTTVRIFRRALATIACAVLLLPCLVPTGAHAADTYAAVNNPNPADRLNLRTQPSTGAPSLGKYYNGVRVEVQPYDSAEWAMVRIGSTSGYMLKQYLAFGAAADAVRLAIPLVLVSNPQSSDRLNLRASMSEDSASLGKYYNGTAVEVLGVASAWYHVRVDGITGYMMAAYLTPVEGELSVTGSWLNVNNPNPSDRLHLRTAPSTDAASLGKYYNGVSVEVLSYPSDAWVKVRIGNTSGYMQRQYLTTEPVSSVIPTMTVSNPNPNDRLNLRETMSERAASLGKYYNGTQVEVLGFGEAWHHVRVDGQIGYMMVDYLR